MGFMHFASRPSVLQHSAENRALMKLPIPSAYVPIVSISVPGVSFWDPSCKFRYKCKGATMETASGSCHPLPIRPRLAVPRFVARPRNPNSSDNLDYWVLVKGLNLSYRNRGLK